ncbi:MAG: hypothetical protein ABI340_09675 [Nitrososphaera sp.]
MNKAESENGKFLEELKSNYRRRIEEVDAFSKHFSLMSSDFRTQCLYSVLDMLQYYVELNKKFTTNMPDWYDSNFMIGQSKMITEAWARAIQSFDQAYSQFADYSMKNMRLCNKSWIQLMQYAEKFFDMREGVPKFSTHTMIELIKDAKKVNDAFIQKQFPARDETEAKKKKPVLEKKLE